MKYTLKTIKTVLFIMLFLQNCLCMTKFIKESLDYYDSYCVTPISNDNKSLLEKNPAFFNALKKEISRWQYLDIYNVAFDCLKEKIILKAKHNLSLKMKKITYENEDYLIALAGEILGYNEKSNPMDNWDWSTKDIIERACLHVIKNDIDVIKQHISLARIIAVDRDKEKDNLSLRIMQIPLLFLSGTYTSNANRLNNTLIFLKEFTRFIDTYNFYSSSDISYSHSERALCLALSKDFNRNDINFADFIKTNTIDACVQIRNQNRMCINCENFIKGVDVYFININKMSGYFVNRDYENRYFQCDNSEKKREFLKEFENDLTKVLGNIDYKDNEIDSIFNIVIPKRISDLIPYKNLLFYESSTTEVVKMYLPD